MENVSEREWGDKDGLWCLRNGKIMIKMMPSTAIKSKKGPKKVEE